MANHVLLVVIPCLNEAGTIEGVVRRLLADVDAGGPALRVVIADGGSTDGTLRIVAGLAADHRVTLLDNPGRIQSCAVNRAVEVFGSQTEYFVRMDAHARYPRGYCATLLAEARASGADSVVVRMRTAGHGGFQQAVATAQNSALGNGGSPHRTPGPSTPGTSGQGLSGQGFSGEGRSVHGRWVEHGHHAMFRVEAFRQVGGYDETFAHNEDAELDVRLRATGHRIWLTDRTWCEYHPRATPRALLRQYFNYGSGRAQNALKHSTVPRLRQGLPLLVAPSVALAVLAGLRRLSSARPAGTPAGRPVRPPAKASNRAALPPLGMLPVLGWAAACLGYGTALAARRRHPATILAGPAAMTMHLGWSAGFCWTVLRNLLPSGDFSADEISHQARFSSPDRRDSLRSRTGGRRLPSQGRSAHTVRIEGQSVSSSVTVREV